MEPRVYNLLYEITKLNEYQLGHKNDLIGIINQLVLATYQLEHPAEFDKKLNVILEFYRFYEKGIPQEDTIVYQEFKNKLLHLAKTQNISLK